MGILFFLLLTLIANCKTFDNRNLPCLFPTVACQDIRTAASCGKILSCIQNVWLWKRELNGEQKDYAKSETQRIIFRNLRKGIDVDEIISKVQREPDEKNVAPDTVREALIDNAFASSRRQDLMQGLEENFVDIAAHPVQQQHTSQYHVLNDKESGNIIYMSLSLNEPILQDESPAFILERHHSSEEPTLKYDGAEHHHSSEEPTLKYDGAEHHHSSEEPTLKYDGAEHHHSSEEPTLNYDGAEHHHSSEEPTLNYDGAEHHHSSEEPTLKAESESEVDAHEHTELQKLALSMMHSNVGREPLFGFRKIPIFIKTKLLQKMDDNFQMPSSLDLTEQVERDASTSDHRFDYEKSKSVFPENKNKNKIYVRFAQQDEEGINNDEKKNTEYFRVDEPRKVYIFKDYYNLPHEQNEKFSARIYPDFPAKFLRVLRYNAFLNLLKEAKGDIKNNPFSTRGRFESNQEESVDGTSSGRPTKSQSISLFSPFDFGWRDREMAGDDNDCHACVKVLQETALNLKGSVSRGFLSFCNTLPKIVRNDCLIFFQEVVLNYFDNVIERIPFEEICGDMGMCKTDGKWVANSCTLCDKLVNDSSKGQELADSPKILREICDVVTKPYRHGCA